MALTVEGVTGRDLGRPAVVALNDPRATEPELTGSKAAALAVAAAAGLPVLPGAVVTTAASRSRGPCVPRSEGPLGPQFDEELRDAWSRLTRGGRRALAVRSSSTVEDGLETSMAGVFTSVLDVRGWEDVRGAIDEVLASGRVPPALSGRSGPRSSSPAPMGVLIQPFLKAVSGGVLFGVDPVSGRDDRLVVAASDRGPAAVVSGAVDGTTYTLSLRGRQLAPPEGPSVLRRSQRRRLAQLAGAVRQLFGAAQDVEWAFDEEGRLWLLQARPVTAVGDAGVAAGPVLGPGPVAETFPDALSPLEDDLWVEPLREALRHAVALSGTVPRRRLRSSPVVVNVDGWLAADLELFGVPAGHRSWLHRLDPRPPARRLGAAWRVGRLRAALPTLAAGLVEQVDADLFAQPALPGLGDDDLLRLLDGAGRGLTAVHGHEVLMGWLAAPNESSTTAAAVALRLLAGERAEGRDDDDIVARHPTVLALVPPRIGGPPSLPEVVGAPAPAPEPDPGSEAAVLREALRLRARWLQELSARAAWELGARLQARGFLADVSLVRDLRLDELRSAVRSGAVPADLAARGAPAGVPLPARFRLTAAGQVVPLTDSHAGRQDGTGAGGGRGVGTVHAGTGRPDPGEVLVVRTLDPGLAPLLPGLNGLVAETGSVLSHLALLAREYGVPTAVAVPEAVTRFPPGTVVVVDGSTGEVSVVDDVRGAA